MHGNNQSSCRSISTIIVLFLQIDNESSATCDITTYIIVPCDRRSGCYAGEQSDQENIPNDISEMAQPQQNLSGEVLYKS